MLNDGVVFGAVVAKELEIGLVDGQEVLQGDSIELRKISSEEL